MNGRRILTALAAVLLGALAWRTGGWAGLALLGSGLLLWLLLNYTRIMTIMKRAADRPVGYVGSAVMLNAKLKPGATLLHVVAMTRSLGLLQSPPDTQPEVYRWTDGSGSHVTAEFRSGKLVQWTMFRPLEPTPAVEPAPQALPPAPPAAP